MSSDHVTSSDIPEYFLPYTEKLQALADQVFIATKPFLGSDNYTGCAVRLAKVEESPGSLSLVAGELGQHEARLHELAAEKVSRLRMKHVELGHVTSAQSRDPHAAKLGGAVIARELIISVAGLTEVANEAVALCLARQLGLLNRSQADVIAHIRRNALFTDLSTALEL